MAVQITYPWILFDADGTLFDYDQAEAQALRETFEQFGHSYVPVHLTTYRPINAQLWLELEQGAVTPAALQMLRFERLLAALNLHSDAATFSESYLRNLANAWALIDGAEEVVKTLSRSHHMLIITNGLRDVQRPRLNASPIGRYFDDVIISEEIGVAKPARAYFDVTFARMGNPDRREVLIVGDSLSSDIKGGIDYGIDTCWFNPQSKPRPEGMDIRYEIADLRQLIGICG
jgi:2-haloacid dehalogenase